MRSSDRFEFVDGIVSQEVDLLLDESILSRDELFDAYARALNFPPYFGKNWDAFIDCLSDLSWLDQDDVIVLHVALPLMSDAEVHSYLDCLMDVLDRLQPHDRPQPHFRFFERDRKKIDRLLQASS